MTAIDVAVCVIRNGSTFLISQRREDDHFGGFWEFPGGKREDGETLEAAATREAKEEVGLDVAIESYLMKIENPYRHKNITLHFFLCSILRPSGADTRDKVSDTFEPVEAQTLECQAVRWVGAEGLVEHLFPPANAKVIEYLRETFASPSG